MRPNPIAKVVTPPKEGMQKHFSAKTPLDRNAGKMRVVCDHCGTVFYRAAAHVRRASRPQQAHHYCGRGCAAEGLKVEVHTNCVVCGVDMVKSPIKSARVVTCGKACSCQRRKKKNVVLGRAWPEYRQAVAAVSQKSLCCCGCGRTTGPWVVRGLLAGESPTLWARVCHMRDLVEKVGSRKRASAEGLQTAIRMLEKHGYVVMPPQT